MPQGYQYPEEDDFSGLDEWLCEYVDGTIDPVAREAFEEYMRQNPALRHHVECLCRTRYLLRRYGCRCQAPNGLQPRLRRRLAEEMMEESAPLLSQTTTHLSTFVAFTSAVVIMMMLGSLTGDLLLPEYDPLQPGVTVTAAPSQNIPEAGPVGPPPPYLSFSTTRYPSGPALLGAYSPGMSSRPALRRAQNTFQLDSLLGTTVAPATTDLRRLVLHK